MVHGLEGRTPFLEPDLTDFCFTLPDDLKVQGRMGKVLLRHWLEKHGPKNFNPWSRKQGFTVPVGDWIAARGAAIGKLVARQESIRAMAHADKIPALFMHSGAREKIAAWTLLFYAVWHRVHMGGVDANGDVFGVLAAD